MCPKFGSLCFIAVALIGKNAANLVTLLGVITGKSKHGKRGLKLENAI